MILGIQTLAFISIEELYHVVTLMGFLQGVMLTVLMWRRRAQQGGIYLVFHLAAMSLVMLFPLLEESVGLRYTWPIHVLVCFLFQGMFLYVRQFQRPVDKTDLWLHLWLPTALLTALAYHTYAGLFDMNDPGIEQNAWVTSFSLLKIAINIGYVSFTLWLLRRHRRLTQSVYSETSEVNLDWVSRLIAGFLMIILFGAGLYFTGRFGGWSMRLTDMLTYAGFVVYLYYAYSHAVQQRPVLSLEQPSDSLNQPRNKYQRSTLTAEQASAIHARIRQAMEEQHLYNDSELTLPALSETVGAPTYHISQVLSELAGANFYDFVNQYRVEAAKRLLQDPDKKHYTVLAIAFESGFNSKTTFNKVFRKATGLTPTAYLAGLEE